MCSGLGIPLNHRLAVVQEKNVILKVAPNSCNYISFIHRLKVFFSRNIFVFGDQTSTDLTFSFRIFVVRQNLMAYLSIHLH